MLWTANSRLLYKEGSADAKEGKKDSECMHHGVLAPLWMQPDGAWYPQHHVFDIDTASVPEFTFPSPRLITPLAHGKEENRHGSR
jgi:hypothetical protein